MGLHRIPEKYCHKYCHIVIEKLSPGPSTSFSVSALEKFECLLADTA